MKMKTKRRSEPHFAFPAMIIFSLCLPASANHTDYPSATRGTWNPISQNLSGSQSATPANTNSPLSISFNNNTSRVEAQTSTPQPPSPAPGAGAASATAGPWNRSEPGGTGKETCEDNKSLILVCFIIIAALVLICTFLFLSMVVTANKMSHLKKTVQGKRRPRSNGDIVATNSLWPTTAGTWQRTPREAAGAELVMQELIAGRDAAGQRKTQDETSEKLTKETDNEQENKEPKSHKPILANFVVEI
ncbi:protein EVI2A [Patagioenas fasciata]|uniref:protein EVI2A n=1 Tax=Patagioenas fasciata TaxID=372321 RepID=UPI0032E87F7A